MTEQTESIVGMRKKIKAQAEHVRRLEKRIRELKQASAAQGELVDALEHARTFIRNGVEQGFITMPDHDTPDPAHDTLPKVERALGAYRAAIAAQGVRDE